MMATVPQTSSSLLPLLESLEDSNVGQSEQTDAYLTIANRINGEEGRQFLPAVVKHFSRLGKTLQTHIASQNVELSQAALQALGFCVFHSHVVSTIPASFAEELLSALSSLVVKSTEKNTCTRALWVISKQNFPPEVVAKRVPEVLETLESVRTREDIQSIVMEHEALNVVIRLLEQAPVQMGEGAERWASLVIPLVVHSASKVRLRAAVAMEMGMPLLLAKQQEVAAIIEPMMSTKLIPELQKLFSSKNETNVLKLWPLFVRLLGKLLHRGGPFINSLLHLEELGFRSSSPNVKKIAFIAWKSLIDNFALNPDILSSAKRLKLLMQPLSSIQVRTEALLLTKLEVWWYLLVKLGPNMAANFEQVGVPLLQCTLGLDTPSPATPARNSSHSGVVGTSTPKAGTPGFGSPAVTPRMNLNSSIHPVQAYPSIQLLGLEMLLHCFLGPEVTSTAARNKLVLGLEPLSHTLLSSPSSFTKHALLLTSLVRDGFITIGKNAPDALLTLLWKHLVSYVSSTIDAAGHKKDRHGCEVLTLVLQALQSVVTSEALPAQRVLGLLETTVRGIPQRVLGSASYQVGKMDVLNGTPALFLIQLLFNNSLVPAFVEEERFFLCLETLVGCGLSGPTSPLAFGEAVLGAMGRAACVLDHKEQLWRMWSVVVNPLTDTITQTNEVNQGDALEHNFSAVHTALMFPITYLLPGKPLPQMSQKSLLSTWSRLYTVFARCSALVATAEENVCCDELCNKMAAVLDLKALMTPPTMDAVVHILLVIIESVDFSPYTPQFQQKTKSPHTPQPWLRKKRALGNLFSFQTLLVRALETFTALEGPEAASEGAGFTLVSILSCLFTNLALATAIHEALVSLTQPLTQFYQQAYGSQNEEPKFSSNLSAKLDKLLGDVLGCLQTRSALAYDNDLLGLLAPLLCVLFSHRSKHVRSLVTQFWNATFANTLVLTYPDQLKPVLSQVKHNTPIILPGFQSVDVPDELNGQESSESSQLETKLSGVQVSSVGKRDSLLARAGELKEPTPKTSKPVSTKLEFGSPKPPRREVLEEEASIDFVFIPPETKQRVLTEHQKEVKRMKRVDIPAMYNNLDASLDTTAFSQYTQSQEESMDKLQTDEQAQDPAKDSGNTEVQEENMETEEVPELLTKDTQEYSSLTANDHVSASPEQDQGPAEMLPESPDVSMEEAHGHVPVEDPVTEPTASTSPNVSTSPDVVSGTPQQSNNSRRQSFITLEKYAEGKPASPISVTKFTGPLARTSNSQDPSSCSPLSQASLADTGSDSQTPQARQERLKHSGDILPDQQSSQQEKEYRTSPNENEPEVKIPEKRPSEATEDEEDVIPDTQAEEERKEPVVEDVEADSQEEALVEDPACSQSQGEPRRSGRLRSRPLLPGEDPDNVEEKERQSTRGKGPSQTDSQSTPPLAADSQSQGRSSRSSKLAVEVVEAGKPQKKAALKDGSQSSQSNSLMVTPSPTTETNSQSLKSSKRVKLLGDSELVKDKRTKRGSTKEELSQSTSENDSQSQGRRSLRSNVAKEVGRVTRSGKSPKEQGSSQRRVATPSQSESQSQGRTSRRSKIVSDSEEFDLISQSKKEEAALSQGDSQVVTPSSASQNESQSQGRASRSNKVVSESRERVKDEPKTTRKSGTDDELSQGDPQMTPSSDNQPDSQSQSTPSRTSKVVDQLEELVKDESGRIESTDDKSSPNDFQTSTPSSVSQPDSQSLGIGRERSDVSDDTAEPDKSQDLVGDTPEKPCPQTDSQLTPSSRTDGQTMGCRPRRLKLAEQQVNARSALTVEAQSSQVIEEAGTPESSLGRGRSTRRTASQALLSNVETSESDGSEARELVQKAKKRSKRCNSPSPLNVESDRPTPDNEIQMDSSESSQKAEPAIIPIPLASLAVLVSKDLPGSQDAVEVSVPLVSENTVEDCLADNQIHTEGESSESVDPVVVQEKTESENAQPFSQTRPAVEADLTVKDLHARMSPQKCSKGQSIPDTTVSQVDHPGRSDTPVPSSVLLDDVFMDPNAVCAPPLPNGISSDSSPSSDPGEKPSLSLQVSQSSEEKLGDMPQPVEVVAEEQVGDLDEDQRASTEVSEEDRQCTGIDTSTEEVPATCLNVLGKEQDQYTSIKESLPETDGRSIRTGVEVGGKAQADRDAPPPQEKDPASGLGCEDEAGEETQIDNHDLDLPAGAVADSVAPLADVLAAPHPEQTTDVHQDSPAKQRGLAGLGRPEVGDSPSSKTRGVWSPTASPSTSILKKGQKRALVEVETPSPIIKSRRVSFANPIQHQELADDIDRRSPVIRTSSPRSKSPSSIPQPKYITTPTKGLLNFSPRNLRSPGYKSSKKCLISEMGQEPLAIPKDCVYPALVGCSTPVEAVLPQITSNMWPRGFGQLVRARNIKTVGDLSSLTPNEIKKLPIRSPKIMNVKMALRTYHEQQRKGRGDELKSFDEMEKMASELEDMNAPPNQEDDDKSTGEALATELLEEPLAVEQGNPRLSKRPQDGAPEGPLREVRTQGLLSEVEGLGAQMTAESLGRCSAEQLLHVHDQLGSMMRRVVVQLQTRLTQREGQL
ncbi:telomere-associated protein RIF1 isoform X2 [Osmerus eperlanus]|uniref:telomere-associated protein RIF1 isoform X2 n=1 Tax=Osmerus eperlanus TaxID=29151 RepID=UPI002E159726